MNTAAVEHPESISEISRKFGLQCIIVLIEARRNLYGVYETFIRSGKHPTKQDPVVVVLAAVLNRGCG